MKDKYNSTRTLMPNKKDIDSVDRKILKFLIKNARTPFLEIARDCGISGAAIHQRVNKLTRQGIIMGSRLLVDPRQLGFDVCAFVNIRLQDATKHLEAVEKLKNVPEIVECHFVTGEYTLLVKLYCIDNDHLMSVIFNSILQVHGVTATQTYISMNEVFQRQVYVDCLKD